MLTPKDIKKLGEHLLDVFEHRFVTKEDIKGFSTKDDLKGFATKDDLKGFATKEDLKGFATKSDLKNFATKDDFEVLETKVESLMVLNTKVDKLQNTMDSLVSDNRKFDSAVVIQAYRTEELEKWAIPVGKKVGLQFKK